MYLGEFVSKRASKSAATALFLIGLFSQTQVRLGAKIGISEAVCCLIAPFLFINVYRFFKKDGVVLYFWLIILWFIGACISDCVNDSFFAQVIRGISVPIVIFSVSVCIYNTLRKNPDNLKWLLFGIACSSVLSIFVFQRGSAGDIAADTGDLTKAAEAIVGYKLFWANMAMTWLTLPIFIWYVKMPLIYSILTLLGLSVFNLLTGGRSMFLVTFVSFFLIIFGGKTETTLRLVKKRFVLIIIIVLTIGAGSKIAYQYAVEKGYMGEEERIKYERQTSRGKDVLSLIMSGRGDFFIGLFAALDAPIVGQGSQALDYHGYERDFIGKYGSEQEAVEYDRNRIRFGAGVRPIRAHSHIINYWMWHGIFALLFWIYVFYLCVNTIRKRMHFMLEWYGYLAISLPAFFWDFFFSPFGLRVNECTLFCALLILVKMEKDQKRGFLPNMRYR